MTTSDGFCGLLRGASPGDAGRGTPGEAEGSGCRPSCEACEDRRGCQMHSMDEEVPQSRSGGRPPVKEDSKNARNILFGGSNI